MPFRIEVLQDDAIWEARLTTPEVPGWLCVRRGALDAEGFPLQPVGEPVVAEDPSSFLRVDGGASLRREALDRFVREEPRVGERDVEALGGYLFGVLIGGDWPALCAKANSAPIRLLLLLPPNSLWEELPWELMIGPDGPLVQFKQPVSIARVIGPENVARTLAIDIPLRVLFVLGREVDHQLRPVAEYISLLRYLQSTIGWSASAIGVALHSWVLSDATTDDVEKAVCDFKPSIVHIIAHGQISGKESVVLLTRYEGSARVNPRVDPVTASRFAQSVSASDDAARPHVVILNACNTARVGDVYVSFAAELVRRGIPLAVGMSGEVADTACRLFTRQFYSAVVEQQQVDVASARGRRAALLHFGNYKETFDWARAVLCQANGVATRFHVNHLQQNLIAAADNWRPKNKREPFCGRLSWLARFRELFNGGICNLAIESREEISDDEDRPQIGKSRLLEELQWQSVLEGWIPVLIDEDRPRFSNLMHFGVSLFELLEEVRETFGCPRLYDSALVRYACETWHVQYATGTPDQFLHARDAVIALLQPQQRLADITHDTIRLKLRDDLEHLRQDVEVATGSRKGILLLWDQLDKQEAIGEECVRCMKRWGFGSEPCPSPVVFTYSPRSPGGKKLLAAINERTHISIQPLSLYDEAETKTACRQFLAWLKVVPSRARRSLFDESIGEFEDSVHGYPSNLFNFEEKGLGVLKRLKILLDCDDASIMSQYG